MTSPPILSSWSFEPLAAIGLSLIALIYWRGWRRLSRQAPNRFPIERLWAFFTGLGAIYFALASPFDAFDRWLLIFHMIQHLFLTMIAPPLLLLGAPFLPILSGLPRHVARTALGPFLTDPFLQCLGRFLVHPLFAGPVFMLSNLIWHVPALYELALRSGNWHKFEHACFLLTAILFWWPVIQPWPYRPVWPSWAMIPYLLLADLQNTALGAFFSFSESVIYPAYANAPRIFQIPVLNDQTGAGALMWVAGSIFFLVPAGLLAMQYLAPAQVNSAPARRSLQTLPKRPPFDLLNFLIIGRLLRWPYFRRTMQTTLFLLAIAIVIDGFWGPQVAPMNLAGVLPWTHWRAFTVIGLLVAGNLFCMACPFTLARDLGRKIFPATHQWPRILRSKWAAAGLLVVFFWAYEAFDLWKSPASTAFIILGYFTAAILIDGFFKNASFCKYVCPIGQFHFVSSLTSPFEIRIREADVCASCRTHDCIQGNETQRGCELLLFQPRKAGNMDCTFCLDCIKACPHDNVGIRPVIPGRDIVHDPQRSSVGQFSRRPDIALLLLVIVSAAFVNAAGMIAPVSRWEESLRFNFGPLITSAIMIGLFLCALVLIPILLACCCAGVGCYFAGVQKKWPDVARGFSAALVPLGFSMWLSHFLFHFLTATHTPLPIFQRIAKDLGFSKSPPQWNVPSLAFANLPALQILILNAGCLLSLWILWQKSKNLSQTKAGSLFTPWAIVTLALYTLGIWITFQPMGMRGTFMP